MSWSDKDNGRGSLQAKDAVRLRVSVMVRVRVGVRMVATARAIIAGISVGIVAGCQGQG